MKLNNAEFQLDLANPKVVENLNFEVSIFNEIVKEINQMEINIGEKVMRKKILLCVSLKRIFGDGADKKIFGNKITIDECENVLKQFNKEVNKEVNKQYSQLKGIVIEFPLKN